MGKMTREPVVVWNAPPAELTCTKAQGLLGRPFPLARSQSPSTAHGPARPSASNSSFSYMCYMCSVLGAAPRGWI